jgi:hypothetical protein
MKETWNWIVRRSCFLCLCIFTLWAFGKWPKSWHARPIIYFQWQGIEAVNPPLYNGPQNIIDTLISDGRFLLVFTAMPSS